MKIIVEIKSVYGLKTVYPACENSKTLAQIAGTKTLTNETLKLIQKLGYEIEVKAQKLSLY